MGSGTGVSRVNSPRGMCVVRLRNCVQAYVSRDGRFQLRVPELCLEQGRFYAMVGPSGSGKSSMIDMLGLVRRPASADEFSMSGHDPVEIDLGGTASVRTGSGGVVSEAPRIDVHALWQGECDAVLAGLRRGHVGYVLQTGGLLPFLTARANVALALRLAGASSRGDEVEDLLHALGIAHVAGRLPRTLSGGERQRVAIARALVHRPRLILADEPTAAIDRDRARAVVEILATRARQQGAAVVMVTHDRDVVRDVADVMLTSRPVPAPEGEVWYELVETP